MTEPYRFQDERHILRPVLTNCSVQSQSGDFLTRAAAKREVELKLQWVEAKQIEAARGAEVRGDVESRLKRERLTPMEPTEQPDSNLVDWEPNDPENPQNCGSFLVRGKYDLNYFSSFQV